MVSKFLPFIALGALFITSCDQADTVEITETRPVTTRDGVPKLFADQDTRFRDAKPDPFISELPAGWVKVPSTQFRDMNYKFGQSGKGEVYLSIAGGGPIENANRWMRQFGKPDLTQDQAAALEQTTMLGNPAYVVETEGRFGGGMGKQPQDDFALIGVIGAHDGRLITVKMLGPEAEVKAEKEKVLSWVSSLKERPSE